MSDNYAEADRDHAPIPASGYGDEVSDNCATCGLATTGDGKRHGYDGWEQQRPATAAQKPPVSTLTITITINVPDGQAVDYLEVVAGEIEDGYTSGHVDAETNWEMTTS